MGIGQEWQNMISEYNLAVRKELLIIILSVFLQSPILLYYNNIDILDSFKNIIRCLYYNILAKIIAVVFKLAKIFE